MRIAEEGNRGVTAAACFGVMDSWDMLNRCMHVMIMEVGLIRAMRNGFTHPD